MEEDEAVQILGDTEKLIGKEIDKVRYNIKVESEEVSPGTFDQAIMVELEADDNPGFAFLKPGNVYHLNLGSWSTGHDWSIPAIDDEVRKWLSDLAGVETG